MKRQEEQQKWNGKEEELEEEIVKYSATVKVQQGEIARLNELLNKRYDCLLLRQHA